jgi:hypothetical protein
VLLLAQGSGPTSFQLTSAFVTKHSSGLATAGAFYAAIAMARSAGVETRKRSPTKCSAETGRARARSGTDPAFSGPARSTRTRVLLRPHFGLVNGWQQALLDVRVHGKQVERGDNSLDCSLRCEQLEKHLLP